MVERRAFLANPRHQHHTSQWGEHDFSANNKKNGDYYKNPSLFDFTDNFDYKENDGKKCFSCQTKASISCIWIRWTWLLSQ